MRPSRRIIQNIQTASELYFALALAASILINDEDSFIFMMTAYFFFICYSFCSSVTKKDDGRATIRKIMEVVLFLIAITSMEKFFVHAPEWVQPICDIGIPAMATYLLILAKQHPLPEP
jgi:hypothetical protein